ncbi:hypothetical protein EDD85DRAFT_931032 [Armillaria nabsnona]|nr:hypothetical protein EDD85DRAFT_931032 [Armillaria nabsnona]
MYESRAEVGKWIPLASSAMPRQAHNAQDVRALVIAVRRTRPSCPKDWPSHKTYCKAISKAGTNTFNAILFGVNETKPPLIKLPWSYGAVDVGERLQDLDMKLWFEGYDSFRRANYVWQKFGIDGPPLRHTLAVWYDENFLINGSRINRCIQKITAGKA